MLVSFVVLLMSEFVGLVIGKIKFVDGSEVLGVLVENWLTEGQREIIELGSWCKYIGYFYIV